MQGYLDQQAFVNTGVDREMLTEIFKGLTNLETIDIRDFCAKRERDGTYWASWGATTVEKETGIRLRGSYRGTGSQSRFVSHVFSNLLYATGVAGRTPPRFEVLLRHQPAGLPDSAFHLPNFTFPAVQPVLQNLKVLFLTLNLSDPSSHVHHTHSNGVPVYNTTTGRSLRHFLSCTPNLTHLRLNFQKSHVADNRNFIAWLALTPTSIPEPPQSARFNMEEPPPLSLPHLSALDLGTLNVHRDALLSVVHRFAHRLQRLSLWRVTIEAGRPGPYDQKPNDWSQFFSNLASVPDLELTYLKAGELDQDHNSVNFGTKLDSKGKPERVREYSGKNMKRFIEGLAEEVVVQWPQLSSDASNSDDDEDMYEDEDGEDEDDEENEDGDEGDDDDGDGDA